MAAAAVVVGGFSSEQCEQMRLAMLKGRCEPTFCPDVDTAIALLGDSKQPVPQCVLLDTDAPGVEPFIAWMRGEARLFCVPVVAVVARASDAAFVEAHALGADDALVAQDLAGLTRRMANLAEFDPSVRPPIVQGRAVIAHPERARRQVLGRIMRQGGFDVSFAASANELVAISSSGDAPSVVVLSQALPPGTGITAIEALRSACERRVPAIVIAAASELAGVTDATDEMGAVGVASDHAPPDDLLFIANELLRPDVKNLRASERRLYGALCGFRKAGEMGSSYGLTYNISGEGLYIRTLDPPPSGVKIWLELRPPWSPEVVHIRGAVVWVRAVASRGGGAAPPGFGVRLSVDDSAAPDIASYRAAYETLCAGQ